MKSSSRYAALDVHQATTVASAREGGGRVIARMVLPTGGPTLLESFRGMRGAVRVAFEEGTQAQWLHDLLVPVVRRVVVCNRRGESAQGNKGDRLDADALSVSELLRRGALKPVYHGGPHRAKLQGLAQELARSYRTAARAEWLRQLPDAGVRFRAEALYAELAVLQRLRLEAKTAMLAEAARDPAWPALRMLRGIPYPGPIRVAPLLATLQTPWRFRTKRHPWAYAGLAVVTRTSAEYALDGHRAIRRRRGRPLTRGLNRNHDRMLKDVFKGAATAASARAGALHDWYRGLLARGMREELARVALARKLAALTLRLRERGERYDPARLTVQVQEAPRSRTPLGRIVRPTRPQDVGTWVRKAVSPRAFARPGRPPRYSANHRPFRRTRRSVRPALEKHSRPSLR